MEDDFDDYLEIEADATNFTMNETYCIATNSVFSRLDLSNVDDLDDLTEAMDDLEDATNKLLDGTSDGSDKLIDGISQLKDGALELKDGMIEYNDEAISKLTDMDTEDLQEVIDRMKATSSVSENYDSFTGSNDGMDSSVKFIYKINAVK